jgi:hypothetical protein
MANLTIGGIGDLRFATYHADNIARAGFYTFLATDAAIDTFDCHGIFSKYCGVLRGDQ